MSYIFKKAKINCEECYQEMQKESPDSRRAKGLQNDALSFLQRGMESLPDTLDANTLDFFNAAGDMCEKCVYDDTYIVSYINDGLSEIAALQSK